MRMNELVGDSQEEGWLHETDPSLSIIDIASLTAAFQAASASTRVFRVSKVRTVWADLSIWL